MTLCLQRFFRDGIEETKFRPASTMSKHSDGKPRECFDFLESNSGSNSVMVLFEVSKAAKNPSGALR